MDFDIRMFVVIIAALYLFYIFFENLISAFSKTASFTHSAGLTLGNVVL